MATLQELVGLTADSDLEDKVTAALLIACQAVLEGSPVDSDKAYAAHVFSNPKAEARKAVMSVLAGNKAATVAQIKAAPDAAVQTKVNAVLDTLSVAYNLQIAAAPAA